MKKQVNIKTSKSLGTRILLGLMTGVGVLLCGALLIAWLISAEYIGEGSAGYGIVIIMLLAGFASAMLVIAAGQFSRVAAAAISAAGLTGFLLLMNLLLGVGSMGGFIQTALVILAGSACAIFINTDKKRRAKYHFKK